LLVYLFVLFVYVLVVVVVVVFRRTEEASNQSEDPQRQNNAPARKTATPEKRMKELQATGKSRCSSRSFVVDCDGMPMKFSLRLHPHETKMRHKLKLPFYSGQQGRKQLQSLGPADF
jgi:hypothetical protein